MAVLGSGCSDRGDNPDLRVHRMILGDMRDMLVCARCLRTFWSPSPWANHVRCCDGYRGRQGSVVMWRMEKWDRLMLGTAAPSTQRLADNVERLAISLCWPGSFRWL